MGWWLLALDLFMIFFSVFQSRQLRLQKVKREKDTIWADFWSLFSFMWYFHKIYAFFSIFIWLFFLFPWWFFCSLFLWGCSQECLQYSFPTLIASFIKPPTSIFPFHKFQYSHSLLYSFISVFLFLSNTFFLFLQSACWSGCVP